MKFKSIFASALAGLMLLASCSKDNDGGSKSGNGEGDFYIKLSQVETRTTTDPFDPTANSVFTTFHNGAVLFVDKDDNIVHPVLVGENNAAVKPSQLVAGYTFASVSNKAVKVVIIANVDFGVSPSFSTIAKLKADYKTDLEKEVTDVNGNVDTDDLSIDYATMWGEAPIYDAPAAADWDKQADVTLAPVSSRFELWQLTGKKYTDDNVEGIDADYVIDAIYLSNYYYEVGPDGQAVDAIADLINWKKDWTKYFPMSESGNITGTTPPQVYDGRYDDDLEGIIFDLLNITASNHVGAAGTGKTWAYNAFANSQATPHIVIKLSNIKQNGVLRPNPVTTIDGTGYITINRYLNTTDMTSIYPMESGMVYSIENLPFSYSDIKDTPEPSDDFTVHVKVTVKPWKVLKVAGGIDKG